ncbi:MAG: DNA polymerase I [Clostridiales bacterium]|nr:DNA polymerase I [Clostridiales bacterium]
MKLLVIDGNSIANRAYYGIRILSTKTGFHTNAIYGFLNILLKLESICEPDSVAVAFDVHEPTFRHKMYSEYKAGRHAMPEELCEQMPVLEKLLNLLGYKTVKCPGWEADDILGTFAENCRALGNECFIATGDRDSLQLAHGSVRVLLARTKNSQAVTDVYDEAAIEAEYGIKPPALLQVKALQGDASDNIPGVRGVGEKTALKLIQSFGSIDYIYEHIDEIDIKASLREKLKNDKEKAYLSLELGKIRTDVPIDSLISHYTKSIADPEAAANELQRLELFSMFDKFGIDKNAAVSAAKGNAAVPPERKITRLTCLDADFLLKKINESTVSYVLPEFLPAQNSIAALHFAFGDEIITFPGEGAEYKYLVKNYFENSVKKYSYNTKELYKLACKLGVQLKNVCGDLLLSAYLLRADNASYDIDKLCLEYGVQLPEYINSLGANEKAVSQAAALKELFEKTDNELKAAGQEKLLYEIELPLSKVLAKMEIVGFEADPVGIQNFKEKLTKRIDELTRSIYDGAGHEFNINSPQQLGRVLFEEMHLPPQGKSKRGYSTKAEDLEALAESYPIVAQVLEYRKLAKLRSTYCDGLLKVIEKDGRIHTSFNQVETRTGRISSLEPNLQNIPIRTELGREMRRFFRAADGCMLVDADYSQIELRVLANLSGDKNMIDAFNSGEDIHKTTASQVFGLPPEMITPMLRSRAKAVNFGIVYGIGPYSLAKDIGVSHKEAKEYIDGYLRHFSGVCEYMNKMIESAKETGWAKTQFNRRRFLPELKSKNHALKSFGERVARNMPIQGTAADIIKIAMVRVDKRLEAEHMNSRLILQVHDELMIEAPADEAERALEIVTQEMQNACTGAVPYVADGKIAKTWYDAH